MGIWAFGKRKVKQHFRVKVWMNYDGLRESTTWLMRLLSQVYTVSNSKRREDFDSAMKRLGLTDAALKKRQLFFKKMIWLYLCCFVLMLIYGYYYLYGQTRNVFLLVSVCFVSLLLLAQAFRYSYWLCQIARRKLGCSVFEWLLWLMRVNP